MQTKTNSLQTNGLVLPVLNAPINPDPAQSMPSSWQCSVILHPFSPPPAGVAPAESPFFQLCTATITYVADVAMSIQITGSQGGTWWFMVSPGVTEFNDNGTWVDVNMGWTMPGTQWLLKSTCAGSSFLNWMEGQMTDWWKAPMPLAGMPGTNASAWYWINEEPGLEGMPFRMMFGGPPPKPGTGDPNQLAFLQMFSFTYFTNYTFDNISIPDIWLDIPVAGFNFGNFAGYDTFVWNQNFGMTVFMTPANEKYNPLPTEVLYVWKDDASYKVLTDRAQRTAMGYDNNQPTDQINEVVFMYGDAGGNVPPPPASGATFIVDNFTDKQQHCLKLPLAQEPPNWATAAVGDGVIQACISGNTELCPNNNIMVLSVIFPPSAQYSQGRYLWVWYSPFDDGSNGLHSRPVTFMESASAIDVGTSLALADYFDYANFAEPIDPSIFDLPASCNIAK